MLLACVLLLGCAPAPGSLLPASSDTLAVTAASLLEPRAVRYEAAAGAGGGGGGAAALRFALVSDDDERSRDAREFVWRSQLQRGSLRRTGPLSYGVEWGRRSALHSHTAYKNRSMELSELVRYRRAPPSSDLLLGVCDSTGIVFKLSPDGGAFQRWAIADGNGEVR